MPFCTIHFHYEIYSDIKFIVIEFILVSVWKALNMKIVDRKSQL